MLSFFDSVLSLYDILTSMTIEEEGSFVYVNGIQNKFYELLQLQIITNLVYIISYIDNKETIIRDRCVKFEKEGKLRYATSNGCIILNIRITRVRK